MSLILRYRNFVWSSWLDKHRILILAALISLLHYILTGCSGYRLLLIFMVCNKHKFMCRLVHSGLRNNLTTNLHNWILLITVLSSSRYSHKALRGFYCYVIIGVMVVFRKSLFGDHSFSIDPFCGWLEILFLVMGQSSRSSPMMLLII